MIITIPLIIFSAASSEMPITKELLVFCSSCVGLGFGGLGGLFPIITRVICGMDNYGLACGMLLGPVPIGIFLSNMVFAHFYDKALSDQPGLSVCHGNSCFVNAFQILLIIQILPLFLSLGLYYTRTRHPRK